MLVVTGSCSADSGFRGQISLPEDPPPVPAPATPQHTASPSDTRPQGRRRCTHSRAVGPGLDPASARRTQRYAAGRERR